MAAVGMGLFVAVALVLPGHGSMTAPLRDGLLAQLGAGACVLVAVLVTTGVRLLQRHGVGAAVGCLATGLGAVGLVALIAPTTGGEVGRGMSTALRDRLGGGGAAVFLLLLVCLGLVLAVDLRIGPVAAAAVAGGRVLRTRWTAARADTVTTPALPVMERLPAPAREECGALAGGGPGGSGGWTLPSIDLLEVVEDTRVQLEQEICATRAAIEATLAAFGVDAVVRGVNSGPMVTQYELQPAPGVAARKITSRETDLSLALAAPIRMQAPIPGKAAIGIEVPNRAAQLVTLRDVVQSAAFRTARGGLALALGADVSGAPVVGDLTRMPHLLIGGATNSGKSVCLNAILAGLLLQATPAQLCLLLVDPKRVELSGFADLPHLLHPVVVDADVAVEALHGVVKEMDARYQRLAARAVRNLDGYNILAGVEPLPRIVVVIDELADLMMVAAGEVEQHICRLAALARAVGIHLVVATQRPSADIITGLIKANIPSRIAFAVSSGVDSRVVLDEMGAEKLVGRGDMLYRPIDEGRARRLQGAFVSDRELERLIAHWKGQGAPEYGSDIIAQTPVAAVAAIPAPQGAGAPSPDHVVSRPRLVVLDEDADPLLDPAATRETGGGVGVADEGGPA